MKAYFWAAVILALFLINSFSAVSLAYSDYDHIYVEVTEVPYRPVYAFLGLNA